VSTCEAGVEIIDPDPSDPGLARVGDDVVVWSRGDLLTFAVGGSREAPVLVGTVTERMRPAGDRLWALRLRVPRLERACVEYGLLGRLQQESYDGIRVWRGPKAPRALELEVPPGDRLRAKAIGRSAIARLHRVRFWSPPDPRALLVCADGEALDPWVDLVKAAGEPVALVGIDSAGLAVETDEILRDDFHYDPQEDTRSRAYLADVDPTYFDAHMRYATGVVVPWVENQTGPLPRIAFGCSSGAAWAASAAALNPRFFSGVLAFSIGMPPEPPAPPGAPPHALVAGLLEPGFHRQTRSYARKLRYRGVPVRLRSPVRGHDFTMWREEFLPALRWTSSFA
jgi:hypothetical protein